MTTANVLPLASVVFDLSIYPRDRPVEDQVKRYAEALEAGAVFPPITLDQHSRLLDGAHRLEAFKRVGVPEIPVEYLTVADDAEAYRVACERNTGHGIQMNRSERYKAALRLFESGEDVKEIARILGTPDRTVHNWTAKVREAKDAERDAYIERRIQEGATQAAIAKELGVSEGLISQLFKIRNFAKTKVVTIGYEGHTLQTFLAALKAAKVTHLWDVRDSNTSQMKPEFSGGQLASACRAAGIVYEHKKRLGIPHMLRALLLNGPFQFSEMDVKTAYEWYLSSYGEPVNFDDLRAQIAGNGRTALMCLEAPGKLCHRHFLTDLIGLKTEDVSALGREAVTA